MMEWKIKHIFIIVFFFSIFFSIILGNTSFLYAQIATTTDTLKTKIDERTNQIKQLEAEIQQYNTEVTNAGTAAKTLQNTIKTLDITKKKITTDITLTETKISKTNLTIQQLDKDIEDTKDHIDLNKKAIIEALQKTRTLETQGMLAMVLSHKDLGDMWADIDDIQQIRESVQNTTKELTILKKSMEAQEDSLNGQKKSLVSLSKDLTGKKQVVQQTTAEKAALLTETKNKEENFKALVKTKEQQKAQFEKEIFDYESQLKYLIDPNSYPKPSNSVLSWPLDNVYITQKFGKTVGAEKLYTSGSHNGIDLRASIGTRVKNVLDGTVVGTGNTDAYSGCYSFGKWVMVKHDNGLSTIYGHLSVISSETGQRLSTGDTIGYSGNTGYSTGPHLHISVYATQGVRIEKYVNSRGCKEATMPLADIRAYLDPLAYFPSV